MRCLAAMLVLLMLVGCGQQEAVTIGADDGKHGHFEGSVTTTLVGRRDMKLEEDFCFVDSTGRKWVAKRGSVINGASIPPVLWSVIGGPYEGEYRMAAVVHDVACDERKASCGDTHFMFYQACLAGGCEQSLALTMYWGILLRGPRWSSDGHVMVMKPSLEEPYSNYFSSETVRQMQIYIEEHELDSAQIRDGTFEGGPLDPQTLFGQASEND